MFAFRALWIIDTRSEQVLFSRRFPTVERRVRLQDGPSRYVPVPEDDRYVALTAAKKRKGAGTLTPDGLRESLWLEIDAVPSSSSSSSGAKKGGGGVHHPRGALGGNTTMSGGLGQGASALMQAESTTAAASPKKIGGTIGPFIFQSPTKDLSGGPLQCFSSLLIVGLPAVSHISPVAGLSSPGSMNFGGSTASSTTTVAAETALHGPGSLLEYPCVTACQQILLDYFAPFISAVTIARDRHFVELGLTSTLVRSQQESEGRKEKRTTRTFGFLGKKEDAISAGAGGSDFVALGDAVIVVSLRAWQHALILFTQTYFPFGGATYLKPPAVGFNTAVDRLLKGAAPAPLSSLTESAASSGAEGGDQVEFPSIVDLILRLERNSGSSTTFPTSTHGGRGGGTSSAGAARDDQVEGFEEDQMIIPNDSFEGQSSANAAVGKGDGSSSSVSLQIVEEVSGRFFGPKVPSRCAVVSSVNAIRPKKRNVVSTFVVLGLKTQTTSVLISPEVHVLHHTAEPVNQKQRMFGSNSSSESAILRHADTAAGSSSGVEGAGNGKVVEATFVQATVEPNSDAPISRLLLAPNINNPRLVPIGGDNNAASMNWRESALKGPFQGSLEVLPILSRASDRMHVEDLRSSQLLVEFYLQLELDLCPHLPVNPVVGPTVEVADSSSSGGGSSSAPSKVMMDSMVVKIQFQNDCEILSSGDFLQITGMQPSPSGGGGATRDSYRVVNGHTIEWTLPPKTQRKNGTQFCLEGTCVINSPVARTTTVKHSQLPPLSDRQQEPPIKIPTSEFGDVPALVLEGATTRVEGSGAAGGGAASVSGGSYATVQHQCPIPIVSAIVDFQMTVPDRRFLINPCEVLDTSSFADGVGSVESKGKVSNPYGAGQCPGHCTVENNLIIKSSPYTTPKTKHGDTIMAGSGSCGVNPAAGTGTSASALAPTQPIGLGGYVFWNKFNDGGFHLPIDEEV